MSQAREESLWTCPRLSYLEGVFQSFIAFGEGLNNAHELNHDPMKLILKKQFDADGLKDAQGISEVEEEVGRGDLDSGPALFEQGLMALCIGPFFVAVVNRDEVAV
jgi:hypothetical protein